MHIKVKEPWATWQ